MLKERILSGGVLAALLLAAIIGLPNRAFGIAAMLLFGLAAWEWAALTSLKAQPWRFAYTLAVVAILIGLWRYPGSALSHGWVITAAIIWCLMVPVLAAYVHTAGRPPRWQPLLAALGGVLLPAAWLSFVALHKMHFGWLLYFLTLCVAADSMAYLTGKMWGRHKLAPDLSPGKTREGLLGGLGGVVAVAIVTVLYLQPTVFDAISFLFLSLITGLFSVEGDLFESLLKREAGVKDSGTLLPGHGGILDRFDSHIAAAPIFLIGLRWLFG